MFFFLVEEKNYLSDFFLFAREDYMMFIYDRCGLFSGKKIKKKNSRDLDNFFYLKFKWYYVKA